MATEKLLFYAHWRSKDGNHRINFISSGDLRLPVGLTVLHVEQEVVGDKTPAIESVLEADTERASLLAEMAKLKTKDDQDAVSERLGEIFSRLVLIDADSAPARAAAILHGLGFDPEMQVCRKSL